MLRPIVRNYMDTYSKRWESRQCEQFDDWASPDSNNNKKFPVRCLFYSEKKSTGKLESEIKFTSNLFTVQINQCRHHHRCELFHGRWRKKELNEKKERNQLKHEYKSSVEQHLRWMVSDSVTCSTTNDSSQFSVITPDTRVFHSKGLFHNIWHAISEAILAEKTRMRIEAESVFRAQTFNALSFVARPMWHTHTRKWAS